MLIELDKKRIDTFIEVSKKDILENNLNNDNYCIIVYTSSFYTPQRVYKIYKSLKEFESKIEKDIIILDSYLSVDFSIYIFD